MREVNPTALIGTSGVRRLCVALIGAALLAGGCGGSGSIDDSVRSQLNERGQDTSIIPDPGPVVRAKCQQQKDLRYRDSPVFACDIFYESGNESEVCAAKVNGEVVLQADAPSDALHAAFVAGARQLADAHPGGFHGLPWSGRRNPPD